MKRLLTVLMLAASMLVLAGCPLEKDARDTNAALAGLIVYGQKTYGDSCKANTTQPVCQAINKGVDYQNALTTAIQSYCGWPTNAPPPPIGTKCVPVKSAEGALNVAIANGRQFATELRGALGQ